MRWNYVSIPKLQRCNRWSLGMDKYLHTTLYNGCNYLSMLGLKLNHVSKRGPCGLWATRKSAGLNLTITVKKTIAFLSIGEHKGQASVKAEQNTNWKNCLQNRIYLHGEPLLSNDFPIIADEIDDIIMQHHGKRAVNNYQIRLFARISEWLDRHMWLHWEQKLSVLHTTWYLGLGSGLQG